MRLLLALLLLLSAPGADAERSTQQGEFQLHYNAFTSGFLSPEMARRAGILRSRTKGVLIVSIQRDGEPWKGRVEVTAVDAKRRRQDVVMRELTESRAVSYVGSFDIREGESLRFSIRATPEGQREVLAVDFAQAFFEGR